MTTRFARALPALALVAEFAALTYGERRRPLRATRESRIAHAARNVALAAVAAVPTLLVETPLCAALAGYASRRRIGVVARLPLPASVRTIASIVLLDYALYAWHRLTHTLPGLWRFHAVHHVDRDLDATTALRFHAGEVTTSVVWRALSLVAIGATPEAYAIWQRLLLASILFQHANLRLPRALERRIGWFVVTPRLHGIHHADAMPLQWSNWSSGLSCWDRLHGSFRDDVAEDAISIGVAGFDRRADVTLGAMLALPFRSRRA